MKHHKLRIAWSVAWGLAVLLLVTCWICSYFNRISFEWYVTPTRRYYLHSLAGCVVVDWQTRIFNEDGEFQASYYVPSYLMQRTTNTGIRIVRFNDTVYSMSASYWLLAFCAACTAVTPWHSFRRYSLRTLLIAMTLVAVGLGLIVWLR